jgi:hypothetical protein
MILSELKDTLSDTKPIKEETNELESDNDIDMDKKTTEKLEEAPLDDKQQEDIALINKEI